MTITFMDIDGTIADAGWRFAKAGTEPKLRGKAYSNWLAKVQSKEMLMRDEAVPGMAKLCWGVPNLVYLTGRSEIYREVTTIWLKMQGFPPSSLLMRPKGSRKPVGLLKETYIKFIEKSGYDTIIVIDDDHKGDLQAICKRNGWTFLKAMSGSGNAT